MNHTVPRYLIVNHHFGTSLEIIWKVIESITNRRIARKVHSHDSLHDFAAKGETGMVYIEAKLLQQMSWIVLKT